MLRASPVSRAVPLHAIVKHLGAGPSRRELALGLFLAAGSVLATPDSAFAQSTLLNVSYDPTRELYREVNEAFSA